AIIRDAQTGKECERFGHDIIRSPLAGTFSPDGAVLALSDGRAIRLFDVATGKELLASAAHRNEVEGVAFSPAGKMALTAGDGIVLWDAASGKQLATLGPRSTVGAAVFAPDGRSVVVGYPDEETIRVWDVATGK